MKKTEEVFLILPGDKVPPDLRRLMPFLFIALVVGVLMAVSFSRSSKPAASTQPAIHSKLAGTVAGHEIRADIDAAGFLVEGPGGAGVEFFRHALVIQQERLLLDGKEKAIIPAAAKLNIVVSDTKLTVMANGKSALRTTVRR
jgi:hypothetical protein